MKHKINCNSCGQEFDMRDLSQVFAHEECNGMPINYETIEKIPHDKGVEIQKRELLKAYAELIQKDYTNHFFDDAVKESIDQFLSL